mgnify:CR=1 FL=1
MCCCSHICGLNNCVSEIVAEQVQIDASWMAHIGAEFDQPYMKSLKQFLRQEKQQGKVIYPAGKHIFNLRRCKIYLKKFIKSMVRHCLSMVACSRGRSRGCCC